MQVATEDAGQSRNLLLDGLDGSRRLVEPGDRELVALSRPGPADDPGDDHWVGLAGYEVPSGRWGDVDVLGARTDHPLVVPGKEPHSFRWRRCFEGVEVLADDVRHGAFDVDRDQPVAKGTRRINSLF